VQTAAAECVAAEKLSEKIPVRVKKKRHPFSRVPPTPMNSTPEFRSYYKPEAYYNTSCIMNTRIVILLYTRILCTCIKLRRPAIRRGVRLVF